MSQDGICYNAGGKEHCLTKTFDAKTSSKPGRPSKIRLFDKKGQQIISSLSSTDTELKKVVYELLEIHLEKPAGSLSDPRSPDHIPDLSQVAKIRKWKKTPFDLQHNEEIEIVLRR